MFSLFCGFVFCGCSIGLSRFWVGCCGRIGLVAGCLWSWFGLVLLLAVVVWLAGGVVLVAGLRLVGMVLVVAKCCGFLLFARGVLLIVLFIALFDFILCFGLELVVVLFECWCGLTVVGCCL